MTRIAPYFIAAFLFMSSCYSPKNPNSKTGTAAAIAQLNDLLQKQELPPQTFTVPSKGPSLVTGKKGTRISINPSDLETESGKPLGPNIEVELKELTNQQDLLSANAQTVAGGRLLVSGGAYFIGMVSNGEKLKLKAGRTLNVQFPQLSNKDMALFYGQRNQQGQMDWQKTPDVLKSDNTPKTTDTPIVPTDVEGNSSDYDAVLDYIKDTAKYKPTPEQVEKTKKLQKTYEANQKVYNAIGLNQLGWINCDRFLEVENKTGLYASLDPKDSIQTANMYLVFKGINSVIQGWGQEDSLPQFANIPIGYKARLIAYALKGEKVFAYSADLTIAKGQRMVLDLKEINDKDFKKLMGSQP